MKLCKDCRWLGCGSLRNGWGTTAGCLYLDSWSQEPVHGIFHVETARDMRIQEDRCGPNARWFQAKDDDGRPDYSFRPEGDI